MHRIIAEFASIAAVGQYSAIPDFGLRFQFARKTDSVRGYGQLLAISAMLAAVSHRFAAKGLLVSHFDKSASHYGSAVVRHYVCAFG